MWAARLFARRWPFYVLTGCAVVAALALVHAFWHFRLADLYGEFIFPPMAGTVVMVWAIGDATGTLPSAALRWERIIERAWAVLVVDAAQSLLMLSWNAMMASSSAAGLVGGFCVLVFGGMLVYAEPWICAETDAPPLTLIPSSVVRSMTLAWLNMPRMFGLLALQIGAALLTGLAASALHRGPGFWVSTAIASLLTIVFAIVFSVAYLQTDAEEARVPR